MLFNTFSLHTMFFLSIIFSISCSSWLTIWMGMEINLFTFIILSLTNKTMFMFESLMKYFLIQACGSMLFLISITINFFFFEEWPQSSILIPPLALMMKSGLAPLHFWVLDTMKKMSFHSLFLFLTMQKLIPLLILFSSWFNMIMWVCVINIVTGSLGGIPQSSLINMLVYSSINNSGWMLITLKESLMLFLIFFLVYMMLMFIMILEMKANKIKWIIQLFSSNKICKIILCSSLLSLMGMPPFLGFSIKWLAMMKVFPQMPLMIMLMIIFSLFTLLFYLKSLTSMMLYSSMKKWTIQFNYRFYFSLMIVINISGPFLLNYIL